MINLNTQTEELVVVAKNLEQLRFSDIAEFSERVFSNQFGETIYNEIAFGFNQNGMPDLNKMKSVAVQVRRMQNTINVMFRNRVFDMVLNISYKRDCSLNQIYLTSFASQQQNQGYHVTALGRSYEIDEHKHPEFHLSEENASYAILLGEDVILGLTEHLKLLRPIAEFAVMMVLIQEER